jgi:hypothetical protein
MVEAVIYDFHGTLADVSGILHLVHEKKYDEFYEASLSCPPIFPTVVAARTSHRNNLVNLLFTGMPDRYHDGLAAWLKRNDVPVGMTLMRQPEDRNAKDFIIKRRMYDHAVGLGYYVVRAWDDSPGVVDLWKAMGISDVIAMPRKELSGEVDTRIPTA